MEGGLALYLVVWLTMCLFEIAVIEVDASLKWIPLQLKLMSGTCIMKRKQTKNATTTKQTEKTTDRVSLQPQFPQL